MGNVLPLICFVVLLLVPFHDVVKSNQTKPNQTGTRDTYCNAQFDGVSGAKGMGDEETVEGGAIGCDTHAHQLPRRIGTKECPPVVSAVQAAKVLPSRCGGRRQHLQHVGRVGARMGGLQRNRGDI